MQRIATVPVLALCLAVCVIAGCATYTPPPPSMIGGETSDRQLANEISNRLSEDAMSGRYTFGVAAQDGVVTIQGAVPDETTRTRILGIVRGTPGVRSVVDRLYRM